jgi:hypothetical protein
MKTLLLLLAAAALAACETFNTAPRDCRWQYRYAMKDTVLTYGTVTLVTQTAYKVDSAWVCVRPDPFAG